jgi:large subunit ribosomal protein L21
MYAIVKTGGKQYKVAPGDVLSVEKLDAEVGEKVELPVLCVVDGDKAEFDAAKAAKTTVVAEVIEQYRDKKVIVFKFKKRKNYKKKNGHRQHLTKLYIEAVGSEKLARKFRTAAELAEAAAEDEEPVEEKPASVEEAKAALEEAVEAVEEKSEEAAAKEDAE